MPYWLARVIHTVVIVVVLAAALWIFLRWYERANVFQPMREWWATGDELDRPWEDVRFTTRDGVQLSGWFFPASAPAAFSNLVVLVNHGNGGNISHRLSLYDLLLNVGVNVFAYDYRGYGRSQGRPSEEGTFLDGEAAIDWLRQRGFAESSIVVHGESLGGAIAVELALRRPALRGLVVRSGFTSVQDLGVELFPYLPVRAVGTIHYEICQKLPHVRVPILFLHSREDTMIGFHHAEANFAAANEPKWLREIRGDHNDQPDASPELYATALHEFFVAISNPSQPAGKSSRILP